MNTTTQLTLNRLMRGKQTRYNPLTSNLDAGQIARRLDAFEVGYLKDAVNIWDTLEQRDDLIRAVVAKRKKAVGRQGWTVLVRDSVGPEQRAEAEEHAAALRYFYENLRCENALDRAERGGFKLLARQMMDAVGKRFAVHEIVWASANDEVRKAMEVHHGDTESTENSKVGRAVPSAPSSSPETNHLLNAKTAKNAKDTQIQNSALHSSTTPSFSPLPPVEPSFSNPHSEIRTPQPSQLIAITNSNPQRQ